MNAADIVLIILIAAACLLAVRHIVRSRRNGNSCGCGCGGCSGCSGGEGCGTENRL